MRVKAWLALAVGGAILIAMVVVGRRPTAEAGADSRSVIVTGPEEILYAPWGQGAGRLGRDDGKESNPEGPMSFAVTPFDEVFVLDQVNQRIACFEAGGGYLGSMALPATTFQDLALTEDGVLVVLDRLVRRSLLLLDADGHVLDEHSFLGEGIPEGGAVTAMFAEQDGIWLEVGHSYRVRVLDEALAPTPQRVRPGRAAGPADLDVVAALDGRGGAAIWLQDAEDGAVYTEQEVTFPHDIARIAGLERGGQDHLILAVHLWSWNASDPARVAHEENRVIVYDGYLNRRAEFKVPWVVRRWEQFREFAVSEEGRLHQMAFGEDGVRIRRWRLSW